MIPPPGPRGTPAVGLPLACLTAAAGAYLLAALGVAGLADPLAAHYYHPRLLALAHTVALGWVTLAILGATYQLVPIVLERPLPSPRLAQATAGGFLVGAIGMVAHFWLGSWAGLGWAAGLVGAAALTHAVHVGSILRRLDRWTFTARLLGVALAGLVLTGLLGLALAARRAGWALVAAPLGAVRPEDPLAAVHAHLHLALLGWVAPMIVGVAARVYPMFLLAPEPDRLSARVQLWGLTAGVPSLVAGLLAGVPALRWLGGLAVAVALGAHATWVAAAVRRRRRPALDWALRFVLTGTAALVPAGLLGLALASGLLAGPGWATAYAVLALGGWVSLTIVGMLLKIVPFLVWYRVYGPRVGRAPVPTVGQIGSPAAERLAYGLLVAGTAGLAVAVAAGSRTGIEAGGLALAAGAVALAVALGRALAHCLPGRAPRPAPASATASAR